MDTEKQTKPHDLPPWADWLLLRMEFCVLSVCALGTLFICVAFFVRVCCGPNQLSTLVMKALRFLQENWIVALFFISPMFYRKLAYLTKAGLLEWAVPLQDVTPSPEAVERNPKKKGKTTKKGRK